MSAARTCWGIYREPAHSPGRIDDDHAILDCVGEALRARGFDVALVAPDADFPTSFANIFAMSFMEWSATRWAIHKRHGAR